MFLKLLTINCYIYKQVRQTDYDHKVYFLLLESCRI